MLPLPNPRGINCLQPFYCNRCTHFFIDSYLALAILYYVLTLMCAFLKISYKGFANCTAVLCLLFSNKKEKFSFYFCLQRYEKSMKSLLILLPFYVSVLMSASHLNISKVRRCMSEKEREILHPCGAGLDRWRRSILSFSFLAVFTPGVEDGCQPNCLCCLLWTCFFFSQELYLLPVSMKIRFKLLILILKIN